MGESLIGSGIAFPLRFDPSGSLSLVTGHREIEEAIRLIIGTAPGERPMRPDFGCGLDNYVFAPANAATAGRLAFEVHSSLERWEPRIDVIDVVVTPDAAPGCLLIEVQYVIRETNDPRNLVFPFYVIPQESGA